MGPVLVKALQPGQLIVSRNASPSLWVFSIILLLSRLVARLWRGMIDNRDSSGVLQKIAGGQSDRKKIMGLETILKKKLGRADGFRAGSF